MKLVTFNIRYDCKTDGMNNFDFRKPLILEKLHAEKPDIICFQEVLPHVAVWLKENLTGYYVIGCSRNEKLQDEQASIAFRMDRYNLIKMDSIWLSPTPTIPGSRYPEQSLCPRICTEAVFQELDTGCVFRVLNSHFDHRGSTARLCSTQQILQHLQQEAFFPDAPVIFCGDLNAEPNSPEITLLSQNMTLLTPDTGFTYHGYTFTAPEHIDYIFGKGAVTCGNYGLWKDSREGVYLSDHYPIWAELSFT